MAAPAALRRLAGAVPVEGAGGRDGAEGGDTEEHLGAVFPDIDRRMRGGLITMEKVRVVRYGGTDR